MRNCLSWVRNNGWKTLGLLLIGGLVLPTLVACASIMHGTTQDIGVSSQPSGATVVVDNEEKGQTPMSAELDRGEEHTIEITMEGYEPYEVQVTKNVSGWIAGNIVFGGVIGLAVDAINGGMYKLTPEQVEGDLTQASAEFENTDVVVAVTLEPKDDWEKIGQLEQR